ncbi:MAG: hypothetical protein NVSMB32_16970 [Actinomycetota bacterium]
MKITRMVAAGALIVGMSVPALAHMASAEAGTPFKADVAAGQSGQIATANDTDTAAEFNVDDGRKEQVGEQAEANQTGTSQSGSVANDQNTVNTQTGQSGQQGDHSVSGTATP